MIRAANESERARRKEESKEIADCEQAAAILRGHMSPEIRQLFAKIADPYILWQSLENKYGRERVDRRHILGRFHGLKFQKGQGIASHIAEISALAISSNRQNPR